MTKILIANFTTESNEHIDDLCEIKNYILGYGQEVIDLMYLRQTFTDNDVEAIGSLYANGHSSGVVEKNTFTFISERIFRDVWTYRNDIDGILLFLHGASKIENLPGSSGEPYILRKIREIVGPYLPIAVVVDPHGNLNQDYCNDATIMRSYRESPHTDIAETYQIVAQMLIDLIKDNRRTHVIYRKLPLILGGEKSVSSDEPVKSINRLLDIAEQDERIMSASWHVGYLRHDSQHAGCSIVVVPSKKEHTDYANEIADSLAEFVMENKEKFHFHGNALEPNEAIVTALSYENGQVIITDSGDNTTSGSHGESTFLLREFLNAENNLNKKILFSTIKDPQATIRLLNHNVGDAVEIDLGTNRNALTASIKVKGYVKAKGIVHNFHNAKRKFGDAVTISITDSIDIVVANVGISFAEIHQFVAAGIQIHDYDLVIVKQGYLFPELKAECNYSIMALTPGPTYQVAERLPFKLIHRPMYPLDQI